MAIITPPPSSVTRVVTPAAARAATTVAANPSRARSQEPAKAKPTDAVGHVADGIGGVEKTLQVGTGLIDQGAGMAFMGGAAAHFAGMGAEKLGNATKLTFLQKTGHFLGAPARWFNGLTFEKLGFTEKTAARMQPTFDRMGRMAEKIGNATGFKTWRVNANSGKAAASLQHAKNMLEELTPEAIASLPSGVHTHLHDIHDMVSKATHAGHIDAERLKTAKEGLGTALKGAKLGKAETKVVGNFGKLTTTLEKTAHHHGKATGWKDIAGFFKKSPGKIPKAAAGHALLGGAFAFTSGLSMVTDTYTLGHNLAALRQMYADMTGTPVKDVSNTRVMLGDVPAPLASARKHLVGNYGLKQIMDVANIGLQVTTMGFGKMMVAMGGVTMLSQVADNMLSTAMLPAYMQLRDMHVKGKEISAEMYAGLLEMASPEMQSRQGSPLVLAVAQQYADAKASPADVLKEVASGKVMARLHGVIDANEAKKHVSHVDKLNGQGKEQRPVVGAHTQQLANAPAPVSGRAPS